MLYLEDYLEMIEHLPQELRDRFTEMRELDLAVQNNMDSLDKKSRFFFQQCKRGELHNDSINTEFYSLRSEYFKVMEDSDEKVAIATQIHELVERYLRRLDNELFKFKCELEADNNGITEILEKRSLELDGNNSTAVTSLLQNISQKENRYYNTNLIHNFIGGGFNSDAGIITNIGNNCASLLGSGSTLNYLSANNCSVSGSNQRNRKLEKRRETICTVPVQEKRTNLNQSLPVADNAISGGGTIINVVMGNHVNSAAHITLPVASSSAKNNAPAALGGNVIRQLSTNLTAHTGLSTNTNNATAAILNSNVGLGAIAGKGTTIPGNHGNAIVSYSLQQLGRGAAGSSAIAAAASQAIVTTQQMPQGRRTASLKASYEAIHGATVNTSTEFWSAAVAHNNGIQPVTATLANSITHHQQQPLNNQHYQEKKKKKLVTGMSMSGGIVQPASGSTSGNSITSSLSPISADSMDKISNVSLQRNNVTPQVNQLATGLVNTAGASTAAVPPILVHNVNNVTASTIGLPSTALAPVSNFAISENGLVIEQTNDGEWSYDPNEPRYCTCNQVSYGDMVACDNDACPYEWFHYQCVGISQPPKGKWYCPKCTVSLRRRGNRKN